MRPDASAACDGDFSDTRIRNQVDVSKLPCTAFSEILIEVVIIPILALSLEDFD